MQHILDAIQASQRSTSAAPEDFATLEIPDHYRAATVHKDEVDMFEGIASKDKDPRKVDPRRGRGPARARPG